MPGKAMLAPRQGAKPCVAMPPGNSTTQHSCAVSHGGHAGAAPMWLWKTQGSGTCPERALLAARGSCCWWGLPAGTCREAGAAGGGVVDCDHTSAGKTLSIEVVRAQSPQA